MYNTTVYLGKERKCAISLMEATDTTVTRLTVRTENFGHTLYVDNSTPQLFDDLSTKTINCCRTVRPNRKMMAKSVKQKTKLKQDNTEMAVR